MTASFIQKIKWFVLLWMGNSVSLFTKNKVRAEDAVFQIQSTFVEGVFHWKPMYKLHKGRKRIIGSTIAFQDTKEHLIFFFSSLSLIQKEVTLQGVWVFFCRTRKPFFEGKERYVGVGDGGDDVRCWTRRYTRPRVQELFLIIKYFSTHKHINMIIRAEVALEFLCWSGLQVPLALEGWQRNLSWICFIIYVFRGSNEGKYLRASPVATTVERAFFV